MIGISGAGLLSLVLLKEVEMKKHVEGSYGLHDKKRENERVMVNEVDGGADVNANTSGVDQVPPV